MSEQIDEATARFLQTAADDLARQLGIAGIVEDVQLEHSGGEVAIVASIRVGHRTLRFRGSGENLIAAYADLRRGDPEGMLAAAFVELVDSRPQAPR